MAQQTILLTIDKSARASCLNSWIEAAYSEDLHLSVLVVAIAQPMPTAAYGAAPYGGIIVTDEWQKCIKQDAEELSKKVQEIESAFSKGGVSADVCGTHQDLANIGDDVANFVCFSELAVIPDGHNLDPTVEAKIISSLIFQSPAALVLHSAEPMEVLKPKKIFVAWKIGLPAARAVHLALPQLQNAQEVIIGIFDPDMNAHHDGEDPGADIAKWLSRRGCNVVVQQLTTGGKSIAERIEAQADQLGVELIVMGAYGHSKLRERIFGGTTKTMIEGAKIPVLFAH